MEGTIVRNLNNNSGMKGLSVVVMAAACIWATNGYAGSDEDAVKAAVAAYNEAVDSLDPAKIEALWIHDDNVIDFEPGDKTIAFGWDGVKKNLEEHFQYDAELKNTQVDGPHIQIKGDVARSMGISMATLKMKNGASGSGGILETDVFEKHDGAWLLVSHSASAIPGV
jgi:ketosteroid isomerase-like protein